MSTQDPIRGSGPSGPSGPSWKVRPYRPGDEEALVALFHRVFGRSITVDHWRWKFLAYPSPVDNVWLAVDSSDRPVFHYAGIPRPLHLPGRGVVQAMVTVDAMTAPEFRRRGVFTKVVQAAHGAWREAGIPFLLGLPNDQWGSRIQALEYRPLFPLKWRIRPLRPEALVGRRLRLPGLDRWTWAGKAWNRIWDRRSAPAVGGVERVDISLVDRAGEEFDQLGTSWRPDDEISVVRDARWVNWRYLDSPQIPYQVLVARHRGQVVGYLAYRLTPTEDSEARLFGFIAEIVAPPGDEDLRQALIGAALKRLHSAGAQAVATLAIPESPLCRTLRRRGFLWSWGEFQFHGVFLDPAVVALETVRDPDRWILLGGDFDVV